MPYEARQGPIRQGAWEQSKIGKILRLIGSGERFGTARLLRPLAERIDPSVAEKLERHKDVYAGDVLNALFPSKSEFPTPLEKGLRALGGMTLGAAVDPLTFLTLGKVAGIRGLTTAGRTAMKAGKLVGPASHQAAMGQRAALTFAGKAAVPRQVSEAAFRGLEAIQRGQLGRQALGAVGAPELGALWDRMINSAAQKFGFNIGADGWLVKSHQELLSAMTGTQKLRTDEVIDTLEPMLERLSRDYSRKYSIPEYEAYMKLKAVVLEAADMHPHIQLAKEAQTNKLRFETVPTRSPYERARHVVQRNFGLPPSFGGPASVMDNDLLRRTREIVIERSRMAKNVLAQEEQALGRELRIVTHPDAGYNAGIVSREAHKVVADNIEKVKGIVIGSGRGARPYVVKPTEHVTNHIARRLRIVDPEGLQRLKLQGVLEPVNLTVLRKGKRRILRVDPYKLFSDEVGRPMSKKALRLANLLVDRKILSLDDVDPNYAGHLIPAMSVTDKSRWIYENGWGKLIPAKTVRNFFETDPTIIDAIRGGRADRAVLSKEWFDAVKARGTDPQQPWAARLVREIGDPDTPSDWVRVRGIPELDGYKMAPDEAAFMKRYYEADLNLGPALRTFAKILGVANRGYRAWTLAIFGPYHSKNYAGGMWNYYLGSENVGEAVANIHRSASAWKAIRGGRASARAWRLKGVKNPTTGKDWTASEIWRAAAAENSWGVGHVSAESSSIRRHMQYVKKYGIDDPEQALLRGARADWKANGKVGKPHIGPPPPNIAGKIRLGFVGEHPWIERGFRFGTYVDDRIRMSHMIQKLREGYPMPDAIRSVKKYFFDYHQISPMERRWGREVFPFYTWCCSGDTECLSKEGWKTLDEVSVGEEILAYKDGSLIWDVVEAVNIFPYSGELVRVANKRNEFLYTPSHRCLVEDHKGDEKIVSAMKLRSNHRLIRRGEYQWPRESVLSPRDAAILGWLVADGYYRWRGSHMEALIYQSLKKYLDEIVALLGVEGSVRKAHPDTGVVPISILVSCTERLKKVFRSKDDLPGIVSRLNRSAAESMWMAMFHADGTEQETYQHFAQVPGPVLDAAQMLMLMFGKTSDITTRGMYLGSGRPMKCAGAVGTSWYHGRVWCPTTSSGTWVSRRKGKVVITGNSRKNIPFQIEMLITRPDRMARFHGGLQTWEGAEETPPDETFVGGWFRKNFVTRIMRNRQGKLLYFAFRSWLPLIDIADVFNMVEWAKQGLTPWIRLPLEQWSNHIWYTDRQIDRMNHLLEGEQVRMGTGRGLGLKGRGVPVPNRLAHVVKSFRLTNTMRQIIDNPQELDFHTRLLQQIIGRLYPLDVGRGQLELVKELEAIDQDTRNSIRSAILRGQAGDTQRLGRLGEKRKAKIFKERGL